MRRRVGPIAFGIGAAMGSACLVGCGGANQGLSATSDEDIHRSGAEFDLAVGLMQEPNGAAAAFQHLETSLELDPDNAEAHLLMGNLYLFRHEFESAENHLREAIRANTALAGAGRPALDSEAQNSLGVLYIHMERYDDAIGALRTATADLMNRTPHLAWGNLGWAYVEQEDYRNAIDALRQAVALQSRFCGAWFRLGLAYLKTGEGATDEAIASQSYRQAEEALTHGLEVDDEACHALQESWRLRGVARARLGRRDEATADLERCVELEPDSQAGRHCRALLAEVGPDEPADEVVSSAPEQDTSASLESAPEVAR